MTIKKLLLLFSFLSIFAANTDLAAQSKICDYCKKEITTGNYLQVEGKFFHANHFKCAHCRSSIGGKYFSHKGKYYHETCYQNHIHEKCAKCRKPIKGKYVSFENKIYHKDCYEKYIALKCSHCNKEINGNYFQDFWGNKYHSSHLNTEQQCDYCSRIISAELTGGGKTTSDGRHICNLCRKSSVTSITKAKRLLDEIKYKLSNEGIIFGDAKIDLHLVDLNELKNVVKKGYNKKVRGYSTYNYQKMNGKIINKDYDIYILTNMPESYYKMIAAHELMHIWQYINSPEKNNEVLSEGSCEYAAYLVIQKFYSKTYKYLIKTLNENDDPVYGDGFRRVKRLAKTKGKRYWLNWLKKNREFPPGF